MTGRYQFDTQPTEIGLIPQSTDVIAYKKGPTIHTATLSELPNYYSNFAFKNFSFHVPLSSLIPFFHWMMQKH